MTSEFLAFPLDDRPRLRPVEAFPVEQRGQRMVVLRDPGDPDLAPIAVGDGVVELLGLLDGQRTIDGIQRLLQTRGPGIDPSQLRTLLEQLDRAGYLEGARARYRHQQRRARFQERPLRLAVHAGGAYPNSVGELPDFLAAGYVHADGPGALPGRRDPELSPPPAIIAPHVDLHRGAPTYSWAYRALAEAQPADLYVVLGTCHTPVVGAFAASSKPYDTPLGVVPTDRGFVDRVARLWGNDVYQGEFAHAAEHSIEFQAVYLRSLGLAGAEGAPMVAILCDSLHSLVPPGRTPAEGGMVADFLSALRQALAEDGRRATLIAAVDLAHVGPRFGDSWLVDGDRLAWVGDGDREMLAHVVDGDADAYYQQVVRDHDARRICGFTPIYLITALMGQMGARGDLLRYTQWVAPDATSSVTFAGLVFSS